MFGNNDNIKDVAWENIEDNKSGIINFRKKNRRFNRIMRYIVFILIASISGAITSAYIVNKKYSKLINSGELVNLVNKKAEEKSNGKVGYNAVTTVVESVRPAVVGIISNIQNSPNESNEVVGSGIIFDPNGYIVTSYNNIKKLKEINVKLANYGKVLKAELVGKDSVSDLAVIKINAKNLPIAKFGDSSKIRVGDISISIGNNVDEEFSGSVTAGIISSLNRRIKENGVNYKIIQTDANVNYINNGGALCNSSGEIIGINSIKMRDTKNKAMSSMGAAIASNEVNKILTQLVKYGDIVKPSIGVNGKHIHLNNEHDIEGVYVQDVIKHGAADTAGIRPTDIIIEIDGKKTMSFNSLLNIVEKHKIGDKVKCKIWRNGNTKDIDMVIGDDSKEK